MGTQVGTPAWVPDSVEEDSGLTEEDTGVAKHWFVHLRRVSHKASERTHVKMDTAGHNSRMSSRASSGIPTNWPSTGSSIVSAGTVGECAAACATIVAVNMMLQRQGECRFERPNREHWHSMWLACYWVMNTVGQDSSLNRQ